MSSIVVKNATLIRFGEKPTIEFNREIRIKDGKVESIKDAPPEKRDGPEELTLDGDFGRIVVDAKGKIVMPGLINAHHHFYSSLARGLYKVEPAKNFVEVLKNMWWKWDRNLTHEATYHSALFSTVEAIKQGTTLIVDHHSSPNAIDGSLSKIAEAVSKAGIRAISCYEVSDRDGGDKALQGIEENESFYNKCKEINCSRFRSMMGLHASFTLGDETLQKAADKAKELDLGIHIHAAEANHDQEFTREKYGKTVIERLDQFGLLGEKTILAHGVHLSDSDLELVAERKAALIHNPQSNLNNAVGILDTQKALEKGVLIGLGTDAMTNNMFQELRVAHLVQKNLHQRPDLPLSPTVDMLLKNNYTIASRFIEGMTGELNEGDIADLLIVDYYPPTELFDKSFCGHFLFGLAEAEVDTTIVDGKILMQDKILTVLNEEEIAQNAMEASIPLWESF